MELARKPLVPGAPGHMEGHNTHGGLAAAAAFAVKETMMRYDIPGSVIVSLGPAEEQLISRPYIVRAGYFKDVDAIIYLHIGDQIRDRLRPRQLRLDQRQLHLPRQDRARRGRSLGRQGRARRRSS